MPSFNLELTKRLHTAVTLDIQKNLYLIDNEQIYHICME